MYFTQEYQKARQKKVKLEDDVESSENKARDYECKLKSLINELEYSQVEEARRMIGKYKFTHKIRHDHLHIYLKLLLRGEIFEKHYHSSLSNCR